MAARQLHFLTHRVAYSGAIYALLLALVAVARPRQVFDDRGAVRPFGVGEDQTVFSMGVLTVALALLCFYAVTVIDLVLP